MITIRRTLMAALVAAMASPAAIAAPGEPWYLNTTNWAFLTLVIFLLIVWRLGAFKMLTGALDSRAEGIQRELNYAQELRDEASVMLREAERKQQEASETADEIIRQAETDAKAMMAQAEKDLAAVFINFIILVFAIFIYCSIIIQFLYLYLISLFLYF